MTLLVIIGKLVQLAIMGLIWYAISRFIYYVAPRYRRLRLFMDNGVICGILDVKDFQWRTQFTSEQLFDIRHIRYFEEKDSEHDIFGRLVFATVKGDLVMPTANATHHRFYKKCQHAFMTTSQTQQPTEAIEHYPMSDFFVGCVSVGYFPFVVGIIF